DRAGCADGIAARTLHRGAGRCRPPRCRAGVEAAARALDVRQVVDALRRRRSCPPGRAGRDANTRPGRPVRCHHEGERTMTALANPVAAGSHAGSGMSTFVALLKREFQEHRGGLWSAQIWTTVVLLVLMVLSMLIGEAFRLKFFGSVEISTLSSMAMQHVGPHEVREFRQGLGIGLWGLGMINQIVLYFVVLFYCIGTLYDERKDRSILFWKSLPATHT